MYIVRIGGGGVRIGLRLILGQSLYQGFTNGHVTELKADKPSRLRYHEPVEQQR